MDRSGGVLHQNFRHQLSLSLPPVDENSVMNINGHASNLKLNSANGPKSLNSDETTSEVQINGGGGGNKTYISVYDNGELIYFNFLLIYLFIYGKS